MQHVNWAFSGFSTTPQSAKEIAVKMKADVDALWDYQGFFGVPFALVVHRGRLWIQSFVHHRLIVCRWRCGWGGLEERRCRVAVVGLIVLISHLSLVVKTNWLGFSKRK